MNRLNQLQPGFSEIERNNLDSDVNDSQKSNEKQKFVSIQF